MQRTCPVNLTWYFVINAWQFLFTAAFGTSTQGALKRLTRGPTATTGCQSYGETFVATRKLLLP
jgi:hypothetical protein